MTALTEVTREQAALARSKPPPHDLKAERSVLGAVLLDNNVFEDLSSILRESDFYGAGHRKIWQAMEHLIRSGQTADGITLRARLSSLGQLAVVGDDAYLLGLTTDLPSVGNVLSHARLMRSLARQRAMVYAGQSIAKNGLVAHHDIEEYLDSCADMVDEVLERREHPFSQRLITTAWLDTPPDPTPWLLRREDQGVLPLGEVGMLYAPGGRSKTMALVQMGLAVASGSDWLGTFRVISPGDVLLALAEETVAEVRRRIWRIAHALGLSVEARRFALDRMHIFALRGENVGLVTKDHKPSDVHAGLMRYMRSVKRMFRLIVLDPLVRFAAGSDAEMDNDGATAFITCCEKLTRSPGNPTCILAHHTNKASRGREGQREGGSTHHARGVSALTDGGRWAATLDGQGDSVNFTITKSNYAPPTEPVELVRDKEGGGVLRPRTLEERALSERDAGFERKPDIDRAIIQLVTEASAPLAIRTLRKAIGGRATTVDAHVHRLADEGRLAVVSVTARGGTHQRYAIPDRVPQEAEA